MAAKDHLSNLESIAITDTWWKKLHAVPFVSCKFKLTLTPVTCTEHQGKTLFLLKQQTKPVQQVRKRVKLSVYGEEERKHTVFDMSEVSRQAQLAGGTPNIIGNVEDRQNSGLMTPSKTPTNGTNPPGFNPSVDIVKRM